MKKLVSKKKRRFQEDGFDLDMTFITPNIVAMGFPAEKIEGVYRNNMKDVKRFFDTRHKDHYKVYNLCEERDYDPSKFYGRVAKYPFDDHNAPPFLLMKPFCEDVANYLAEDPQNIAVIHCKAGKGRTGVMICSYLLHIKHSKSTQEALDFYGKQRTTDGKGVTIASQLRYVHYYGKYVRENLVYKSTTLLVKAVRLIGVPYFSQGTCVPHFTIRMGPAKVMVYKSTWVEGISKDQKDAILPLSSPVPVCDDVKIEFLHRKSTGKEKMFHLWFNTFFIEDSMRLVVPKNQLDKANKDKKHKLFPRDFAVEIIFEKPDLGVAADMAQLAVAKGAESKPPLGHQGSTVSQDPEYSDSDLTDDDDDDDDEENWEGMPVTDV